MNMAREIRTLDPAPAMTETTVAHNGNYESAVSVAIETFKTTRRPTSVVSHGKRYFQIDASGRFVDRNVIGNAAPVTGQI